MQRVPPGGFGLRYAVSKWPTHQKVIGETNKRFRKPLEISLETLAEKSDLPPVCLGQDEREEQIASVHALICIAKALKARVRDLVADV